MAFSAVRKLASSACGRSSVDVGSGSDLMLVALSSTRGRGAKGRVVASAKFVRRRRLDFDTTPHERLTRQGRVRRPVEVAAMSRKTALTMMMYGASTRAPSGCRLHPVQNHENMRQRVDELLRWAEAMWVYVRI